MRMHASWFGVIHWIQGCGTSVLVPDSGLPSNFHPDHHQLAGVLGAVKGRPGNGREWGDARATAYLTAPARVGVWRAVARGGRSRRRGPRHRPVQVGLHGAARPHPAQQDMRDARRVLWIPPGAQARDDDAPVEWLPVGREGLDHAARRPASAANRPDLAASAGDVQVLPQVRMRPLDKRHHVATNGPWIREKPIAARVVRKV
jgi:hypothetical protein